MDILNIDGVKIAGVVACLPENLYDTNIECGSLFSEEQMKTVIKATGISKKSIVSKGTTSLDLCVLAAKNLLENTGTNSQEIGAVICVTFTPEYLMPSDAPAAQSRLNIPNNSLAFDINMACSGYGYGLFVAATIVKSLNKKVLLLDGDIQSTYLSRLDKSTVPVLADGGSATLLTPTDNSTRWNFSFFTDGSKRDVLKIPSGGTKNPFKQTDMNYIEYEDGSKRRNIDIYMDGFSIFKFVAQEASRFIANFMDENELNSDVLDAFIPHQANMYMISQLGKKLKFKEFQIWKSGDKFGNPSSSSIPLTIAYNANEWFSNGKGSKVLLSGFGGGLSISVAAIDLPKDSFYNVITKKEGQSE